MKADLPRAGTVPGAWAALLLAACVLSSVAWAQDPNYLTSFDVTWYFDKPVTTDGAGDTYQYGTFANGDYYIVGDPNVVIERFDPSSVLVSERYMNGSMLNPTPGRGSTYGRQGYDNGGQYAVQSYTHALNVAYGVTQSTPLHVPPGSSIVSTVSLPDPLADTRLPLESAAVLTVLSSAPEPNSFRPCYSSTDKTVTHTTSDINWAWLQSKEIPATASAPSIATYEAYFERPWLMHVGESAGVCIRPTANMPFYGRSLANRTGPASLLLCCDYAQAEKETLAIRFCQLGLDYYGCLMAAQGASGWDPMLFHSTTDASGVKAVIMIAGQLLGDSAMLDVATKSGDYLYQNGKGPWDVPSDYVWFAFDASVFYVEQYHVDLTAGPSWNPDSRSSALPYIPQFIGLPEWGMSYTLVPTTCNRNWQTAYRMVIGPTYAGVVLPLHILGLRDEYNCDVLFDYTDRYMERGVGQSWRSDVSWVSEMWDQYRADYGTPWTISPFASIVW